MERGGFSLFGLCGRGHSRKKAGLFEVTAPSLLYKFEHHRFHHILQSVEALQGFVHTCHEVSPHARALSHIAFTLRTRHVHITGNQAKLIKH